MTVITLEQVRAWHPCPDYTDARLAELAAGRKSITVDEALDLPIPAEDRIWLLAQPGVLPAVIRYEWVEAVVSRAVREHASACGVAEVEDWAARWLANDPAARTARAAQAAAGWAAQAAAKAAMLATWTAEESIATRAWKTRVYATLAWAVDVWKSAIPDAAWRGAAAARDAGSAERERQIADLRAILATQEKETDRDDNNP